ncbi:MAG: PIG-L deacetylase family protein [Rhabdochlamydiaceae bacterium]
MRILAIGAHPDDVEIGCGGALFAASSLGHEIFIYVATRGEKSGDPEVREVETRKTSELVRATKIKIADFPDTQLRREGELIDSVEAFVKETEPEVIFTHSQNDQHHDHQAVALASIEACRFVPNLLAYESPSARNFQPQAFIDITEVISKKLKLLDIFWSQRGKKYLRKNAIVGLAEYRAFQTRVEQIKYAEAFEVSKMCMSVQLSLFSAPVQVSRSSQGNKRGVSEYSRY